MSQFSIFQTYLVVLMKQLNTVNILGTPVTSSSEDDILQYILLRLENKDSKTVIFTPNPEIVVRAYHNKVYQEVLNDADVLLPDGVGLLWASRTLGIRLQERITGVDFMERLCEEAAKLGLTVGFVGGRNKVAERTSKCLKKRYPGLTVAYASSELKVERLKLNVVDILFVALGAPKQEEWIHENLPKIPVRCAMGVGGAFDYISGDVSRAPRGVRKVGLEWLYRLVREPWRFRRQTKLVEFVGLVLKEKRG